MNHHKPPMCCTLVMGHRLKRNTRRVGNAARVVPSQSPFATRPKNRAALAAWPSCMWRPLWIAWPQA